MYSWAASGVLLFLSLAIGVGAAIRGDGRGMGIVAVIVAVVAGIIPRDQMTSGKVSPITGPEGGGTSSLFGIWPYRMPFGSIRVRGGLPSCQSAHSVPGAVRN